MSLLDLDALIQRVNLVATDFFSDPTRGSSCTQLEDVLHSLVRNTSHIDPTGRLNPHSLHIHQLLVNCNELLGFPSTTLVARSKVLLVLFNITQHNVRVRRYLAGELQIIGTVFRCLLQAIRDNLGPQNMIDILRLLQILTYEKCITFGSWANEMISYLLSELSSDRDPEWLPYCGAILSNLIRRSKTACSKVLASRHYPILEKKLIGFLSHESRTLVIAALTMIGYLDEKKRDIVYSGQHLKETFLCVFNIIKTGETVLTRHMALDLCKRLIISDSSKIFPSPTPASTARELLTYPFFGPSVEELAKHLINLDARTEECLKVYQLFLDVCRLPQFKSHICRAILATKPCENRLTTPVLGMLNCASWSFEEAIEPEVPLAACELLTHVLKEVVDSGDRVQSYVPIENLINLILVNVKTAVETKSELVSYQCRRITCGLKLADAVSGDDDSRRELLDSLTAQLCSHVNESQLISNPVITYMTKPPSMRNSDELPEWSQYGITIPLELFKLLSSLKDYSKAHKELYWKTLKDERLIAFIAFAIYYGESNVVFDALNFFTHCTQVQEFRTKLLSDLIASCAVVQSRSEKKEKKKNQSIDDYGPLDSGFSLSNGFSNRNDLDELLKKLKENINSTGDARISHVLQLFEQKISHMEEKEKILQKMVEEKDKTLQESQRLYAMQRTQGSKSDSTELRELGSVIAGLERQWQEAETEKTALNDEKRILAEQLAKQEAYHERIMETSTKQISDLKKEKEILLEENKKERDVQFAIRAKFDEMKNKFDEATQAAFEKDKEVVEISRKLENALREIEGLKMKLKVEHEASSNKDSTIEKLKDELERMKSLKQAMAKMLNS